MAKRFELVETPAPPANTAIDPVCGMTVDRDRPAATWDYHGERYYFCNPSCLTRFKADPESFLTPVPRPWGVRVRGRSNRRPPARSTSARWTPRFARASPARARSAEWRSNRTWPRRPSSGSNTRARCIPRSFAIEPGACPICGMALEPRTVSSLDDGPNPELTDMTRRFWIAALLGLPVFLLAMGDMVLGMGLGGRIDPRADELDRPGLLDAGRALGRLAVLRARLGVDREPAREHVHADRARRRRRVSRSAWPARSRRRSSPTASASTASSKPTSTLRW